MNTLAMLGIGVPELILLAFVLGGFGLWIWMLVDCLTKETDQNQKLIWVLVLALTGIIGAALYFFLRMLPRKRTSPPDLPRA